MVLGTTRRFEPHPNVIYRIRTVMVKSEAASAVGATEPISLVKHIQESKETSYTMKKRGKARERKLSFRIHKSDAVSFSVRTFLAILRNVQMYKVSVCYSQSHTHAGFFATIAAKRLCA